MDAGLTLNSGQVFLWHMHGRYWYGIDGGVVLKADDTGIVGSSGHTPDFFRDADDIDAIRARLRRDTSLRDAMERYPGLRITRQDPFQCMVSFVVSANSNIPRIRRNLEAICRAFGGTAALDGMKFRTFPSPERLGGAHISEVRSCGTGYRSPYILAAARAVCSMDFEHIRAMPYREARRALTAIPGIGNKVADCILLFSLDFLEAIPLDRWIVRALQDRYDIGTGQVPHTDTQYDSVHDEAVRRLGPHAGYAQQYLFRMVRDDSGKPLKW